MKMSEETKQKLREAAIKRLSNKNNHPMYGKHISKEHRKKLSDFRKTQTGVNASNWKGGSIIVDGYRYIYSPNHPNRTMDKYVAEHRLVMEQHIKRFLEKSEVVHHINGNPLDNKLENLVLCKNAAHHNNQHKRKRNKNGRFI